MIDTKKLEQEQTKLSKKVILKDSFEKPESIAGIDCAYTQDSIIAAIVVCDYATMQHREKVHAVCDTKFPYIPGFLSYREGFAISEAFAKLQLKPNVAMFDGNGILHPRKFGLACHMGVLLDIPSIGIAKEMLLGQLKNSKVYVENESRAESIVTREHANPIYISPGHKITLKTSVEIVRHCLRFPHKLPEPLHLAHKYAKRVSEDLMKEAALKSLKLPS